MIYFVTVFVSWFNKLGVSDDSAMKEEKAHCLSSSCYNLLINVSDLEPWDPPKFRQQWFLSHLCLRSLQNPYILLCGIPLYYFLSFNNVFHHAFKNYSNPQSWIFPLAFFLDFFFTSLLCALYGSNFILTVLSTSQVYWQIPKSGLFRSLTH